MTTPNDALATAYKPVLHAMAGALSMSLAAAARNCETALKAVNDSLSQATEIEKEIAAAQDIQTLLEIQARLGRSWFETAFKNWCTLCQAAGQSQLEMLRRGQAEVARIGEDIRSATAKGYSPESAGTGPWGSFMEAASSACALTAKVTEELTRMAVTQGANMQALSKTAAKAPSRSH